MGCSVIELTGSARNDINGFYEFSSQLNGRPYYIGTRHLFWDRGAWVLSDVRGNREWSCGVGLACGANHWHKWSNALSPVDVTSWSEWNGQAYVTILAANATCATSPPPTPPELPTAQPPLPSPPVPPSPPPTPPRVPTLGFVTGHGFAVGIRSDHIAGRAQSGWTTYPGHADGVGTAALVNEPFGLSLSADEQWLYWADRQGHRIRRMVTATKVVVTVAGDGKIGADDGRALESSFHGPSYTALSPDGARLYIADIWNHKIRVLDTHASMVSTLAGDGNTGSDDGAANVASFHDPNGVALSTDGSLLYVAEYHSRKVRKVVTATGVVSTVAGDGHVAADDGALTSASFKGLTGLCLASDQVLYTMDYAAHSIRKLDLANGRVSTVAGDGAHGYHDGTGSSAFFWDP